MTWGSSAPVLADAAAEQPPIQAVVPAAPEADARVVAATDPDSAREPQESPPFGAGARTLRMRLDARTQLRRLGPGRLWIKGRAAGARRAPMRGMERPYDGEASVESRRQKLWPATVRPFTGGPQWPVWLGRLRWSPGTRDPVSPGPLPATTAARLPDQSSRGRGGNFEASKRLLS